MIFKWVTCCEVLKTLHLKWLNDFDKTTKNNPTVYRKTCEFHPVRYLHHEDNGLIVSVDQKKKVVADLIHFALRFKESRIAKIGETRQPLIAKKRLTSNM